LAFCKKQIPHFVRDDKQRDFFSTLLDGRTGQQSDEGPVPGGRRLMISNLRFEISDFPKRASGRSILSSLHAHTRRILRSVWWWLREVSGDAAYENYLRSAARKRKECRTPGRGIGGGAGRPPMSRHEFYLDALRRRYSGVSRCC
jgi:hypothetical protein